MIVFIVYTCVFVVVSFLMYVFGFCQVDIEFSPYQLFSAETASFFQEDKLQCCNSVSSRKAFIQDMPSGQPCCYLAASYFSNMQSV